MREIKFRAWDSENHYMYMVHDLAFPLGKESGKDVLINGETSEDRIVGLGNLGWLYDYELMQYTGLKDKNGKEVYEGDILSYPNYSNGSRMVNGVWEDFSESVVGEVRYLAEEARFDGPDVGVHANHWAAIIYKAEVIGNRFENPELLGGNHETK